MAGVGDAHMDDPLHAGPLGGLEERAGVGHRHVVIDSVVGEPDPVGVVQRGRSLQRSNQLEVVVEVERSHARSRCPQAPDRHAL